MILVEKIRTMAYRLESLSAGAVVTDEIIQALRMAAREIERLDRYLTPI